MKTKKEEILTNPNQEAIDKKSSLCRRASKAAKNHSGVNITGISLFDAIGQLRLPAPPASAPCLQDLSYQR